MHPSCGVRRSVRLCNSWFTHGSSCEQVQGLKLPHNEPARAGTERVGLQIRV